MGTSGGLIIDAPDGIQFVPAPVSVVGSDDVVICPVWKDDSGRPDRIVVLTILSTTAVALITYSLHQNAWVFDPTIDAVDTTITLAIAAAAAQNDINAFAVESPGTATDPILFISQNDASQTPDTFEMNSIQLADGARSLTAVAVTIAGINQPTDTNGMATVSCALSTSRVLTFFEDDAHFADVTGDESGFTFTYDDAKASAVDTSIVSAQEYSAFLIGSQVVLFQGGDEPDLNRMWEITPAGVLTEEFNPFTAGLSGSQQDIASEHHSTITAIGGHFAIAGPVGGLGAGQPCAYIITTFPLDDI